MSAKDDRIAFLERLLVEQRRWNEKLRETVRCQAITIDHQRVALDVRSQPFALAAAVPKVLLTKTRRGWHCEVVGNCKTFRSTSSFRWLARHRANRDRARYVKAHKAEA